MPENRLESLRHIVDDILHSQPDPEGRRCGFVHLYGVALTAEILAHRRGLNPEVCATAAMLHDISTYRSGDSNNHAARGAVEARQILEQLKLYSREEIDTISEAIRSHSDKESIDSPYCELLKDADVLQHHLYNPELKKAWLPRIQNLKTELGL